MPALTLCSLFGTEELLLQRNFFEDEVPVSLCDLRDAINQRTEPDQFLRLRTDCAATTDGDIQNFCRADCCDRCFIGKEFEP